MMMKLEELTDYIGVLSKAHAAGHKCDKELRTAIELYTIEVGIKTMEKYIDEKVKDESEEKAGVIVISFTSKYYDHVKRTQPLMTPDELYTAFREYVRKTVSKKE